MKIENGQKSADTTALFQFGLSFKDSLLQYDKSTIPLNTSNEFIVPNDEYKEKFKKMYNFFALKPKFNPN